MPLCDTLRNPTAHAAAAVLMALCASASFAQSPDTDAEGPIDWIEDPARAVELARESGRPVLAYVASERCGFCRKMERETWTNAEIARVVGERFVPLRLTATRHRAVVRALGVRAYPSTFVLTPQGRGVSAATGYLPPARLERLLAARPAADAVAARGAAVGR